MSGSSPAGVRRGPRRFEDVPSLSIGLEPPPNAAVPIHPFARARVGGPHVDSFSIGVMEVNDYTRGGSLPVGFEHFAFDLHALPGVGGWQNGQHMGEILWSVEYWCPLGGWAILSEGEGN